MNLRRPHSQFTVPWSMPLFIIDVFAWAWALPHFVFVLLQYRERYPLSARKLLLKVESIKHRIQHWHSMLATVYVDVMILSFCVAFWHWTGTVRECMRAMCVRICCIRICMRLNLLFHLSSPARLKFRLVEFKFHSVRHQAHRRREKEKGRVNHAPCTNHQVTWCIEIQN